MAHNISMTTALTTGSARASSAQMDAWMLMQNAYFVEAGGTELQELIENLIAAATGATIHLGPGVHKIDWTAAHTINQSLTIVVV